ncbi:MAG: FAD:protein FMN transferase [Desulfotignum sp.]
MPFKHICKTLYLLCLLSFFSGGDVQAREREYTIQGRTMGTFYTVKLVSAKKQSIALWQKKIDTRLQQINTGLSMYDPASQISQFNRIGAHQPYRLSKDFFQVMQTAAQIYRLTNGAWDGTVKPLVDIWGFGTKKIPDSPPDKSAITDALSCTGFHRLVLENTHVFKKKACITLDLGSIAKGYGVDALAQVLAASGIDNFLVEIGGELYGSGVNRRKNPWTVGITNPGAKSSDQGFYKVITLDNRAIATSGNYRNFFDMEGKTYSHIIDPTTGFPVDNQVLSVSVIAQNGTFADGLATGLMVMDPADAIDLVNRLEDVECLIIQKTNTSFREITSRRFHTFVQP